MKVNGKYPKFSMSAVTKFTDKIALKKPYFGKTCMYPGHSHISHVAPDERVVDGLSVDACETLFLQRT